MLVVKKFGGSSVADSACIVRSAKRCVEAYHNGDDVVVVLSAMGKTTDYLIKQAREISKELSKRELDMLLSTGEQQSVSLMAIAIQSLGVPAVSLNGFQVPMQTNAVYGNAKLTDIDHVRIRNELKEKKIVIITGFQGVNQYGDLTTLGRGGSDTTAVAVAAALGADLCEIYTDVDGVYTADPRVVKQARKLQDVSYEEMLEFASLGAKVLHNRSVELAKKYEVPLVVRSSMAEIEGTVVTRETKMESMLIRGVAVDNNTARISIKQVQNKPGIAFRIFHLMAENDYNVDVVIQSLGRKDTVDISFTVSRNDITEVTQLLNEKLDYLTASEIEVDEQVSKLSVIGTGITSHPGVAAKMFEALYKIKVNIKMIATSEIRITVLIDEKDTECAMKAVHQAFELAEIQ